MQPDILIEADNIHNAMKVRIAGNVSIKDVKYYANQMLLTSRQLNAGFTLIYDFSDISIESFEVVSILQSTLDLLTRYDVARVIYVKPTDSMVASINFNLKKKLLFVQEETGSFEDAVKMCVV